MRTLANYVGCVDPSPYFNGYYAADVTYILQKYSALVGALSKMWDLIKLTKTA